MMTGPTSSYSCLDINNLLKLESEAKTDAPFQVAYLLSGEALIVSLAFWGSKEAISLESLSTNPGNNVDPPLRTMLP